jgi:predicted NBD/HSP70 family sugar kinase
VHNVTTAGELLQLIRTGQAHTRADLGRLTGLSRTAVTARLDQLQTLGLVADDVGTASRGGRPAGTLAFRPAAGAVVAVAIGRTRVQLAVADLAGTLLSTESGERPVESGPDETMAYVLKRLRALWRRAGSPTVLGFGCSIPGNVDYLRGAGIESQILTGWGGVELAPYLQRLAEAPVYVENDANVLALSERRGHLRTHSNLISLKASTGLGLGLVSAGRLVRGGRAAAGELGHLRSAAAGETPCRCGEIGCLEAVAGGWALVRDLLPVHPGLHHVRDVATLARAGDPDARQAIRAAGRVIGSALAGAVALLNPDALVLGGDMAGAYDVLAAGLKETVFDDLPEAAGRHLEILPATFGEDAGMVGCAQLTIERVVGPRAVDRLLA